MSEDIQAARVRMLTEEVAESVLGGHINNVDTAQVPLWELFDSLSFMQFKAELTSALPIAEEALNFSAIEKPTMDLIIKKILRAIPKVHEAGGNESDDLQAGARGMSSDQQLRALSSSAPVTKTKKKYGKWVATIGESSIVTILLSLITSFWCRRVPCLQA